MVDLNTAGRIASEYGLFAHRYDDDKIYIECMCEEHWLDVTDMTEDETREEAEALTRR